MSETVKCVFVWRSPMDARTCRKCAMLDGRIYYDQDVFAHELVDPEFGPIWNLDEDKSLAHGGAPTCRCRVLVYLENVDFSKTEFWQGLTKLMERMK